MSIAFLPSTTSLVKPTTIISGNNSGNTMYILDVCSNNLNNTTLYSCGITSTLPLDTSSNNLNSIVSLAAYQPILAMCSNSTYTFFLYKTVGPVAPYIGRLTNGTTNLSPTWSNCNNTSANVNTIACDEINLYLSVSDNSHIYQYTNLSATNSNTPTTWNPYTLPSFSPTSIAINNNNLYYTYTITTNSNVIGRINITNVTDNSSTIIGEPITIKNLMFIKTNNTNNQSNLYYYLSDFPTIKYLDTTNNTSYLAYTEPNNYFVTGIYGYGNYIYYSNATNNSIYQAPAISCPIWYPNNNYALTNASPTITPNLFSGNLQGNTMFILDSSNNGSYIYYNISYVNIVNNYPVDTSSNFTLHKYSIDTHNVGPMVSICSNSTYTFYLYGAVSNYYIGRITNSTVSSTVTDIPQFLTLSSSGYSRIVCDENNLYVGSYNSPTMTISKYSMGGVLIDGAFNSSLTINNIINQMTIDSTYLYIATTASSNSSVSTIQLANKTVVNNNLFTTSTGTIITNFSIARDSNGNSIIYYCCNNFFISFYYTATSKHYSNYFQIRNVIGIPTIRSIYSYGNFIYFTDVNYNIYQLLNSNIVGDSGIAPVNGVPCFKEDTLILCMNRDYEEEYIPIQNLRPGTLIKTLRNGYVPINMIGTSKIYNPANKLRGQNRLYRCSKSQYPELIEDLYITGCHSILVNNITEEEKERELELVGDIYITDNMYRLMACIDKRADPYEKEGIYNIWHIALDCDDYYMNYGIYANGLLVETTSKRYMKEYSGMELIE
jgi:hypothetical protein